MVAGIRGPVRATGVVCLVVATLGQVECFSSSRQKVQQTQVATFAIRNPQDDGGQVVSRRGALQEGLWRLTAAAFGLSTTVSVANAAEDIRGIPLSPFNGLIFNYKGSDFGGLDAASLNEPSVSYQDFVQKLKGGQVAFVEFLAPYGDAAYVTFKDGDGKPIRIGEGYPIEQHDGWSSPAFAIRTVVNQGVPYKFTVPALAQFK